jgi:hypothetical protein
MTQKRNSSSYSTYAGDPVFLVLMIIVFGLTILSGGNYTSMTQTGIASLVQTGETIQTGVMNYSASNLNRLMLKHKTKYDDFVNATNDWVRHFNRTQNMVYVRVEGATEDGRQGALMLRKAIQRLEEARDAMQDAVYEMDKYKKELEKHEKAYP